MIDVTKAVQACRLLVDAWNLGASQGGNVDWTDLGDAAVLAAAAIGETLDEDEQPEPDDEPDYDRDGDHHHQMAERLKETRSK